MGNQKVPCQFDPILKTIQSGGSVLIYVAKKSIFNKKIIIKNEIIKLGSKNIDNDIMYIYGVNEDQARYLKENFAVSSTRYADVNETIDIKLSDNEMITINQEDITKVVESRVEELLKLAKKQKIFLELSKED